MLVTLFLRDATRTFSGTKPALLALCDDDTNTLLPDHSEGTNGRALSFALGSVPSAEMTIAKCIDGCDKAGYVLAGAEYGGECCKWNDKLTAPQPLHGSIGTNFSNHVGRLRQYNL